jgi:8-oxo-dGTP pyrophosphatase MutT (NUDIX family)
VRARIAEAVVRGGVRRSKASGREAAVLVPLVEREAGLSIVFTKRTEDVPTHKGQVAFPGGSRDAEDADLQATALREAEEEVGIPRGVVDVVGRLDDYCTISGFVVAPYVGFVPDAIAWRPNPRECAEVIEIPVRDLLSEGYFAKVFRRAGMRRAVLFYRAGGQVVWGATAAMLRDFLDRVGDVLGA